MLRGYWERLILIIYSWDNNKNQLDILLVRRIMANNCNRQAIEKHSFAENRKQGITLQLILPVGKIQLSLMFCLNTLINESNIF